MAGCVQPMDVWLEVREHRVRAGDKMRIRFSWLVAALLMCINVSGWAQQNNTFKVKPSRPEKAPKSIPVGKTAGSVTASTANAKNLQSVEHQNARMSASSRSAGKKAHALTPVKDKPNPPINFTGTGGGKSGRAHGQGADPYRGRLRQKGSR